MFPYYCLVIIPIIFTWQLHQSGSIYLRKRTNELPITLFFLILMILLFFKSTSVGIDTLNYVYYYNKIADSTFENLANFDIEYLYVILNKFISHFFIDVRWLFVIVALISLIPMYLLYKEDCEYVPMKILVFINLPMFPMLFSGLRQAIAVSIGIISYFFVRKKRFFPYLITVLIAFAFHRSAFILLLLYPIYHIRLKRKYLFFVIPIMILIFIFNKQIFSFLSLFISEFFGDVKIMQTGAYAIMALFILFSIFSFVIPNEDLLDKETIGLRNILLLVTCLQFFVPLHPLSMRMNYYFIVFVPVLLPKIMKHANTNMTQIVQILNVVMCVFFIVYYFMGIHTGTDILRLYPYSFCWE